MMSGCLVAHVPRRLDFNQLGKVRAPSSRKKSRGTLLPNFSLSTTHLHPFTASATSTSLTPSGVANLNEQRGRTRPPARKKRMVYVLILALTEFVLIRQAQPPHMHPHPNSEHPPVLRLCLQTRRCSGCARHHCPARRRPRTSARRSAQRARSHGRVGSVLHQVRSHYIRGPRADPRERAPTSDSCSPQFPRFVG